MPRLVLGLLLLVLPSGLTAQQEAPPEYIPYEDWERPLFSQMVIVDRTIYLSGMMGVSPPDWYIVPGGIQPETRQAMENIRSALARAGTSDLPARSAVAVAGLAQHGKVEIECIAVRPTR